MKASWSMWDPRVPADVRPPPGMTRNQWATGYRTMVVAQIMVYLLLFYFAGGVTLGIAQGTLDAVQVMFTALMILAVSVTNMSRKMMAQAAIKRDRDEQRLENLIDLQSSLREAAEHSRTNHDISEYLGHKVIHQANLTDDGEVVISFQCRCGWRGRFVGTPECSEGYIAKSHHEWIVDDAQKRLTAFEHELRSQLGRTEPEEI